MWGISYLLISFQVPNARNSASKIRQKKNELFEKLIKTIETFFRKKMFSTACCLRQVKTIITLDYKNE